MPKQSRSEEKDVFNVDRLFSVMTTATLVIELLACIVLIGAGVGYLLVLTGYYDIISANTDLFVLLFLVGGGITFFILIGFLSVFIRIQDNVKRFVLGGGIGQVVTASREGRVILVLYAGSILFFFIASGYGFYLLWKYYIKIIFQTQSLFIPIMIAAVGLILTCLVAQVISAGVSRYAARVARDIQ